MKEHTWIRAWRGGLGVVWMGLMLLGSVFSSSANAAERDALLIVAPRGLVAGLKEFAEFKSARMPTRVVALEDVLAAEKGADDSEKLKKRLYGEWKTGGVRYVLLVGDADVMPVRYMTLDRVTQPAFDYAFYPSDLYYADVARRDGTFEDWNGNKDGFHAGYFGEVRGEKNKTDPINFDAVDYRPELALGRWPVSNADDLRVVVAKTIAHERAVEAATAEHRAEEGETAWQRRVGLFVVEGWVDARGEFDKLGAALAACKPDWQVEKFYFGSHADGTAEGHNPDRGKVCAPTEEAIIDLLDRGASLVLHAGHGNDDCWAECISVGSIAKLKNGDRLPVMISAGCSTARFATLPPYEAYEDVHGVSHKGTNDGEVFAAPPPAPACYAKGAFNKTGLGEQLLRAGPNGAVAYIGCNTGSQPCGLTLIAGFVDALNNPAASREPSSNRRRVGDCWAHAVAYYFDHENLATIKPNEDWYPASIFFQGMKFMLFGDPTSPVGE